mgnify:CR=1 FL=1
MGCTDDVQDPTSAKRKSLFLQANNNLECRNLSFCLFWGVRLSEKSEKKPREYSNRLKAEVLQHPSSLLLEKP